MIFFNSKWSVRIISLWIVLVKEIKSNDLPTNDNYIHSDTLSRNKSNGDNMLMGLTNILLDSSSTDSFLKNNHIGSLTLSRNKSNEDNITQHDNMLKESINVQLEIIPDCKEYVLESNSSLKDHTFTCSGNQIVKWYFEQYDGRLIRKKNKSVYNKGLKRYVTMFSLSRGAYLNTGYYYCAPFGLEEKSIKQSKNIYVYVQHETHLLAIPNGHIQMISKDSNNGKIIIPCKTTSPGINVRLFYGIHDVTETYQFDEKIGFTIHDGPCKYDKVNILYFKAQKNESNVEESRTIELFNQNTKIYPNTSEYTLLSNTTKYNDNKFSCTAKYHAVNWVFEKYDGTLVKIKSEIVDDKDLRNYTAVMTLRKGSYLDTGYYYCTDMYAGNNLIKQFNKIYIFVQNEENLLAFPHDNHIICPDSDENEVILPCRPTSRDINVKLVVNGFDITDKVRYDQHIGFVLEEFGPYNYTCVAQRNDKSEFRTIINLRIIDKVRYDQHIGFVLEEFGPYNYTCVAQRNDKSEFRTIINLRIIDKVRYDQHIGFVLEEFGPYNYTCVAQRNDKSEFRTIINLRIIDLEISPDVPEYTLTSNSTEHDRMFTCIGSEPVQWYFEQFDGTLLTKNSRSINVISKDFNKNNYLSTFSLNTTTYLDTGYYYCVPLAAESRFIKSFKKIYIFVKHETYLFASPDEYSYTWIRSIDRNKNEFILPCRPTSPDVKVQMYSYDSFISDRFYYDEKIGFISTNLMFQELHQDNITCVMQRDKISIERKLIYNNEFSDYLTIRNEHSDYVFPGQNVTLNCSYTSNFFNADINLKWIFSEKIKNQLEHVRYFQKQQLYSESMSILLNIQNVTTDDGDRYICSIVINDTYHLINKSYELKVIAPNETFLNLKIHNDENTIIRPVRYHSVKWIVEISAYPNSILEWRDPAGNKIQTISEKITVKNYNRSSQLIIRDLEVYDSGVYKLTAFNSAEKKEINVTLLVEDKPLIQSINRTNSRYLFCELGDICSFEFHVTGYPLPEVEWMYSNFTNNTSSVYKQFNTQCNTTKISPVTLKYIMSINVTDIGETVNLTCNATNRFGKSFEEYTVLMSDEFNGFDIKGPSLITAGDNVTIICSASKYSYLNVMIWTYPITNIDNNKIHVIENKTEYSHRSYLMILNISSHFYGNISCTVNRKTESNKVLWETETKSFALKVQEPYAPVLHNILSNSDTLKLTEKPIEMWCNVTGMPPPKISWFKDNRLLLVNESRILMKNLNQKLLIQNPESEDEGIYKCNATNRFGSVTSNYYLSEDTWMSDLFFCCMLSTLLVVVVNGGVLWLIFERKLKREIAVNCKKEFEKGKVTSWNRHLRVEEQVHLLPYDNRWEFPVDKIQLGKQIGSGAYGIVYKAKATGLIDDNTTTTVAIKTVRPSTDPYYTTALASELKIMTHLGRHLNVVNVLGACTTNISKRLMVIVEYCCFGSIDRYLQKHRDGFINQITPDGIIDYDIESLPNACDDHSLLNNVEHEKDVINRKDQTNINRKTLCTNDLLSWSYQVSKGMEFLASRNILHGDLATRNILLAEQNIVKICDFGLAKYMYKKDIYKKSKKTALPIKWLAIESLRYGIFSTASDVWSFGIVLWEIFSLAAVPYPNIQLEDLLNKLIQGYRMEQPIYCNSVIYDVMIDCWKTEPTERPSFSDLSVRVGDLLQECTKSNYVELNNHFMKMYSEKFPSTDVLNLLTAPTVSNNSGVAPDNNTESSRKNTEPYDSNDDNGMNSIVAHKTSY